jgi:hypothetical protein
MQLVAGTGAVSDRVIYRQAAALVACLACAAAPPPFLVRFYVAGQIGSTIRMVVQLNERGLAHVRRRRRQPWRLQPHQTFSISANWLVLVETGDSVAERCWRRKCRAQCRQRASGLIPASATIDTDTRIGAREARRISTLDGSTP